MSKRWMFLIGMIFPLMLGRPGAAQVQTEVPQDCAPGTECPPVDAEREQPVEAAPGQPAEAAVEQPAEAAAGRPAEAVVEQPAEAAAGQPAEAVVEQPAEQPAEPRDGRRRSGEPGTPRAVEVAPQRPAPEQPVEAAVEQPEQPAPQQPAEAVVEQPAEAAAEQPVQAAPEQPAEPRGGRRRSGEPRTPRTAESDAPAPPPATAEAVGTGVDDTVTQQLEAQGDREEAGRVRELRGRLIEQLRDAVAPESVEPAAPGAPRRADRRDARQNRGNERGQDGLYQRDEQRGDVMERRGGRIIIDLGGGDIHVERDIPDEGGRLLQGARDVEVQELPNGRTRSIVYRRNGVQIETIRDRYGEILRRTRRLPDGTEIVLIDNRVDQYRGDADQNRGRINGNRDRAGEEPGRADPRAILRKIRQPRIGIPQDRYIVDLGRASRADIRQALTAPTVDRLERSYSLEEVLRNQELRAYSPRIDLDTITFEFGSATIGDSQMPWLLALGEAMEEVIVQNPRELYLIEGHTDAVGSDYDNLFLSDRRAEAVAVALSQNFDIPPENLVTEGYGEQYLKVPTDGPERRNRRATVRRLTGLLAQK